MSPSSYHADSEPDSSSLSDADSVYEFAPEVLRPAEPQPVSVATDDIPYFDAHAFIVSLGKILNRVEVICVKDWNVLGPGLCWKFMPVVEHGRMLVTDLESGRRRRREHGELKLKRVWSRRVQDYLFEPLEVVEHLVEKFRAEVDVYSWRAR